MAEARALVEDGAMAAGMVPTAVVVTFFKEALVVRLVRMKISMMIANKVVCLAMEFFELVRATMMVEEAATTRDIIGAMAADLMGRIPGFVVADSEVIEAIRTTTGADPILAT